MSRIVLILVAMCTFGATCWGGYDDADVRFAPLEAVKVPWYFCEIDPLTGAPLNPDCEPPPPVEVEVAVQVVHIESGVGLCGVEVHGEGTGGGEVRVRATPLTSDEDGGPTFELGVTLPGPAAGTSSEPALRLTAGNDTIAVTFQAGS